MISTVKWFNPGKGFGFLDPKPESDERDIFVHFSSIKGKGYRVLEQGEEVEFDLIHDKKGWQAFNVKKLGAGEEEVQSAADAARKDAANTGRVLTGSHVRNVSCGFGVV